MKCHGAVCMLVQLHVVSQIEPSSTTRATLTTKQSTMTPHSLFQGYLLLCSQVNSITSLFACWLSGGRLEPLADSSEQVAVNQDDVKLDLQTDASGAASVRLMPSAPSPTLASLVDKCYYSRYRHTVFQLLQILWLQQQYWPRWY